MIINKYNEFDKTLINIDTFCEYCPGVDTLVALVNLAIKGIFTAMEYDKCTNVSPYVAYILHKDTARTLFHLVPIIGWFSLSAWEIFKVSRANQQRCDTGGYCKPNIVDGIVSEFEQTNDDLIKCQSYIATLKGKSPAYINNEVERLACKLRYDFAHELRQSVRVLLDQTIHGMENTFDTNESGYNNCWAIALTQFLRHSQGFGQEYLETLPEGRAKDSLLSVLERYNQGECSKELGQEIRRGFQVSYPSDEDSDGSFHDSSEFLGKLFAEKDEWKTLSLSKKSPQTSLRGQLVTNISEILTKTDINIPQSAQHLGIGFTYDDAGASDSPPIPTSLNIQADNAEGITMEIDAVIIQEERRSTDKYEVDLPSQVKAAHIYSIVRKEGVWFKLDDATVSILPESVARDLLAPDNFTRPICAHYVRAQS